MDVNRRAPSSEEKVDALLIPTDSRGHYIVIYNVNLPMRLFATDATSTAALERVKNLLERDFANAEATFQFTASYLLFHPATRQFRTWTGSFYPRGNAPAMLSTFQPFRPDTFVQFGLGTIFTFKLVLNFINFLICHMCKNKVYIKGISKKTT